MKMLLLYAAALTASIALYNKIAPVALTMDAPIMSIAQAQAAGQPTPAMPLAQAQAQALAAQYQQQAAAIERAEGMQP
ncbi:MULTISPECIES: hypothetical protein [Metallibacterium]|jgi:hypothetical protein|uniref:hypothetical protein n=1 Tax=Metallibacterium TaxID=1218803 RepID=UPI00260B3C88|nr:MULTISPECIES: hypothetical protein [Metallibacterium]MBW8075254.1 hypothetical protein [Metallibacterium scheffleri]